MKKATIFSKALESLKPKLKIFLRIQDLTKNSKCLFLKLPPSHLSVLRSFHSLLPLWEK